MSTPTEPKIPAVRLGIVAALWKDATKDRPEVGLLPTICRQEAQLAQLLELDPAAASKTLDAERKLYADLRVTRQRITRWLRQHGGWESADTSAIWMLAGVEPVNVTAADRGELG